MNWNAFDYLVIGALLIGSAGAYWFLAKKVPKKAHRIVIGIVIAAAVLYIWAELAVGIFTNWGS